MQWKNSRSYAQIPFFMLVIKFYSLGLESQDTQIVQLIKRKHFIFVQDHRQYN